MIHLFRNRADLTSSAKAVWAIFLLILPFIGLLGYTMIGRPTRRSPAGTEPDGAGKRGGAGPKPSGQAGTSASPPQDEGLGETLWTPRHCGEYSALPA